MNDILFRGKRKDTGEWVYDECVLAFNYATKLYGRRNRWQEIEIRVATLGEFTGVCDIHGHEIFEGDIVRGRYKTDDIVGKIVRKQGAFGVACGDKFIPLSELFLPTVIGNVFDNAEIIDK